MNYQKMLNARKMRIKAFVETGLYSLEDIAAFFYTLPDYVRIDIEKMGYSVELLPHSDNPDIKKMIHDRNQIFWNDLVEMTTDEVLEKHGLPIVPYEFPKIRDNFPCREYKALWEGLRFENLPTYLNESRSQVIATLRKYGYSDLESYREIRKLGKQERREAMISEVLGYMEEHIKPPKIQSILGITSGEFTRLKELLIEYGALDTKGHLIKQTSIIGEGIWRGLNQRQIAYFLDISDDIVFHVCKDNHFIENAKNDLNMQKDTPFGFRKKELKEKVYIMHKYEGWTQQEIADHFRLSRATINSYIKYYKANNPIKFDQTYLVRLRNQREGKREVAEKLKSDILLLHDCGCSISEIAKCVNRSEGIVFRYMYQMLLNEQIDSMQSEHYLKPSHAAINERRGQVLDLKLNGERVKDIQKKIKVSQPTLLNDRKILQASLQAYYPKALKEIKEIRAGKNLKDYETYATPTPSRPYATAVLGMHYVKKQEIEKALKEYEDKIDIARDE